MTVFEKLNLKDQPRIIVLNSPESFEPELASLKGVQVARKLADATGAAFLLAFVTKQDEVDKLAKSVGKKLEGDAALWFAYPKGTSKKYKCELNRDQSWGAVGAAGFEPVRLIAIDADWSALRFRRAEFIKTMKRDVKHRISDAGKARK